MAMLFAVMSTRHIEDNSFPEMLKLPFVDLVHLIFELLQERFESVHGNYLEFNRMILQSDQFNKV